MATTPDATPPVEPRTFAFGTIDNQQGGVGLVSVNGQDASGAVVSVQGNQIEEHATLSDNNANFDVSGPMPTPEI